MEDTSSKNHDDDQAKHSSSISPSPQREKWCGGEFLYKFQGFWFTETYLQTTQKVVESFKPNPKDVILASFPKSGTTWLKALLHSITTRSGRKDQNAPPSPLITNHPQELVPSLETNLYVRETSPEFPTITEEEDPESGVTVTILGTHIPYQILGHVLSSSSCKIVYVARNPKDTLVSLWHFVQKADEVKDDPWELDVAVDQFCKGIVVFGPYYDHVLAYREASVNMPEKVFFVTYEEMKEDPKKQVRELGEFLGCPFEGDEEGEMDVEEIVKNCSFEKLSGLEVNKSSELPKGFSLPYSSFYRKGEVGDHKNCLDDGMVEKIDGVTKEKFHGSGFMYGI